MGDGDGWVRCALGHRHWGRFGAAGLLVTDGTVVLLQLRSVHSHEGGTWAVPGGARDHDESVLQAALREAGEESSLDPAAVRPYSEVIDDHGGWSYTTIVAGTRDVCAVESTNFESVEMRWVPIPDVDGLPLHSGFARTWPQLSPLALAPPT